MTFGREDSVAYYSNPFDWGCPFQKRDNHHHQEPNRTSRIPLPIGSQRTTTSGSRSSFSSCSSSSNSSSSSSLKYLCVFCKSNDEPESIYRSHPLRLNNIVVCPSLRNYTCCICKATGDNAHTIKYCPYNKRGFYATRSHEKCNTNNKSKYRMKVHLIESSDKSSSSSIWSSSSMMSQQDEEIFRLITL